VNQVTPAPSNKEMKNTHLASILTTLLTQH
jgi:hypothetical protein